ncbi:hypothetical protein [Geobacter anodireducens]
MAMSYEMYQMGAESFARLADPAMRKFWDGYQQGLSDRFHGGEPQEELIEDQLYARGYRAGLEGKHPVSLIPMLMQDGHA